ncbi:hypothetical protein [Brachybacterium hainanense]|uniref:Uncharacterized protein n=1 Tax=Brachybacterium hainanense TaxID=1541174 RepID=A0ABV6RB01_9MICO
MVGTQDDGDDFTFVPHTRRAIDDAAGYAHLLVHVLRERLAR